jgi:hypothetical protein
VLQLRGGIQWLPAGAPLLKLVVCRLIVSLPGELFLRASGWVTAHVINFMVKGKGHVDVCALQKMKDLYE